ncbi:MAG TPA: hypothetical protein VKH42_16830 [Vicinamibacterales bacterium]|nr:hypothetical protein [Vicinamibacterales bacterium]
MKELVLSPPLLLFVVGTRVAMAFGVGLLASERIPQQKRRPLALSLITIGIATTIPALMKVFGSSKRREYPAFEPHAAV